MSQIPPPPPSVRQLGNGGKLRPEMPVGNLDDEKRRTTPTSINSLSDDNLITILVKLPAQDIHDAGRLVCRRWYCLICSPEFTHTHLQSSPGGILIQCKSKDKVSTAFVGMNQGRIETYKLRYKFIDLVLWSCKGLILQYHNARLSLLVVNPATKQHWFIPPYQKGMSSNRFATCLGYVAASKEYKLVHLTNKKQCAVVLAVGVDDSWRHLPTEHLSNGYGYFLRPGATEGFVHWVTSPKWLVSLDLETETIREVPFPDGLGWWYCFSAGKCVSLVNCLWPKKYCLELWEIKPGPAAEWNKLLDVDFEGRNFEGRKGRVEKLGIRVLEPVGWIKYKEVLLFRFCSSSEFFAYNICTEGIEWFELDFPCDGYFQYADHTNSLLRLDEGTFKTD